jgi:hypothetical protein
LLVRKVVTVSTAPLLLAVLLLGAAAQAGGLRSITLPGLPPCPRPIAVDGRLDEWAGVEPAVFRPLDPSQSKTAGAAVVGLQERDRSVAWRLCYDADALYLACDWHTPQPAVNPTPPDRPDEWDAGDGLELHLRTDRVIHLAA